MRIETKQRLWTVVSKAGKLGSISSDRVKFLDYRPSFQKAVVDMGCKAMFSCRF